MKRLEFLLLTAFIGTGLVTVGCGGSSTSETTPQAKTAAAAPAEAGAPAAQPAASTEPAATSEPSQAGASDTAAGDQEAAKEQEPERRFVPPIRGTADIEILAPKTRVEGSDVVTEIKVRNASTGAIAMLRVDETWYDKAGDAIAGDTYRHRKLFLPGDVIDVVLRCPKSSKYFQNTFQFTHANGKIEVKTVKSFPKTEEGKEGK